VDAVTRRALIGVLFLALVVERPASAFVPPTAKLPVPRGDMVLVPGASFRFAVEAKWQGTTPGNSAYGDPAGYPVTISSFLIDRTEVTVAAYEACVKAGDCPALLDGDNYATNHTVVCNYGKQGLEQHPINCVSHVEAEKYCAFAGKRLPTEYEFELAERGPKGKPFPWGDEAPLPVHVNACDASCAREAQSKLAEQFSNMWPDINGDDGYGFTSPVGTYPAGASPYGALDLSGNVEEWVADPYWDFATLAPGAKPSPPPTGNPTADFVIRGGSWDLNNIDAFSGTRRTEAGANTRAAWLGFRCARDA
jgi:formylglycine-generating enzyme required for sulfatase activity